MSKQVNSVSVLNIVARGHRFYTEIPNNPHQCENGQFEKKGVEKKKEWFEVIGQGTQSRKKPLKRPMYGLEWQTRQVTEAEAALVDWAIDCNVAHKQIAEAKQREHTITNLERVKVSQQNRKRRLYNRQLFGQVVRTQAPDCETRQDISESIGQYIRRRLAEYGIQEMLASYGIKDGHYAIWGLMNAGKIGSRNNLVARQGKDWQTAIDVCLAEFVKNWLSAWNEQDVEFYHAGRQMETKSGKVTWRSPEAWKEKWSMEVGKDGVIFHREARTKKDRGFRPSKAREISEDELAAKIKRNKELGKWTRPTIHPLNVYAVQPYTLIRTSLLSHEECEDRNFGQKSEVWRHTSPLTTRQLLVMMASRAVAAAKADSDTWARDNEDAAEASDKREISKAMRAKWENQERVKIAEQVYKTDKARERCVAVQKVMIEQANATGKVNTMSIAQEIGITQRGVQQIINKIRKTAIGKVE